MIEDKDLPALKQRFKTILQEELGLARFSEDPDGDFTVRYEGMDVYVLFYDNDPAFAWLRTNALWFKATADTPLEALDRAINHVNYRCKAVKLCRFPEPDRDGDYCVVASISHIVDDVASVDSGTIERYLGLIKTGSRELRARLDETGFEEQGSDRPDGSAAMLRH